MMLLLIIIKYKMNEEIKIELNESHSDKFFELILYKKHQRLHRNMLNKKELFHGFHFFFNVPIDNDDDVDFFRM